MMTEEQLRDALDAVILQSGWSADNVVGVLELMLYAYKDQAEQDLEG